jgi:hypothetical protein
VFPPHIPYTTMELWFEGHYSLFLSTTLFSVDSGFPTLRSRADDGQLGLEPWNSQRSAQLENSLSKSALPSTLSGSEGTGCF